MEQQETIFIEMSRVFRVIEQQLEKLIGLGKLAAEQRAEMIKLLQAILDTTQGNDVASFAVTVDSPTKQ